MNLLAQIWPISDKPGQAFIDGLVPAIVCIIIVFLILAVISLIVAGLNKIKSLDEKEEVSTPVSVPTTSKFTMSDITDDDMMAAVLVATIDYQAEIKKDVRVKKVTKIG